MPDENYYWKAEASYNPAQPSKTTKMVDSHNKNLKPPGWRANSDYTVCI